MSGGPYVNHAGVFLVQTVFGLYILAVMLRFLFQWVRADFYNPLVQFLVKITNPPLVPLRRFIPGIMGLDMAAVVLMLGLKMLEYFLVLGLVSRSPGLGALLVLSVADILSLLINVFFWAIIIQAILSWVSPDPRHPLVGLLHRLNEPLLAPARRVLPPMSGLDLSPILVLIALQLLNILVVAPLADMGRGLA